MAKLSDHDWKSAEYLVVDDIPWEFFKCRKQLLGGQREFNCTEKYKGIVTIPFGKPVIYLCNDDVRNEWNSSEELYYEENVVVVNISNKLY